MTALATVWLRLAQCAAHQRNNTFYIYLDAIAGIAVTNITRPGWFQRFSRAMDELMGVAVRRNSGSSAGLVQFAVKSQGLAAHQLGDKKNLPVVHSEVLHHLVNRA